MKIKIPTIFIIIFFLGFTHSLSSQVKTKVRIKPQKMKHLKPDLEVSDISLHPRRCFINHQISVTCFVKNSGGLTAPPAKFIFQIYKSSNKSFDSEIFTISKLLPKEQR